jgi:transcriptional regulator with XRE-family HTH domain
MSSSIGEKLKYFRKRAGKSQLQLENETDAAPGSISRIENGENNPTKETVQKIAKVLDLNNREVDYLIGQLAEPATDEEIRKAREEVSSYFKQKGVLGYIVDDRTRLIDVSDDFVKFLGLDLSSKSKYLNQLMYKLIIDDSLGIKKFIDTNGYYDVLYNVISRGYNEMGFMVDDVYYKEMVDLIFHNELARKTWDRVLKEPKKTFHDYDTRKVKFKVHGIEILMNYSIERLQKFPRFEVIEYTPNNAVIKLLSKII